jgi:hypothetical protein
MWRAPGQRMPHQDKLIVYVIIMASPQLVAGRSWFRHKRRVAVAHLPTTISFPDMFGFYSSTRFKKGALELRSSSRVSHTSSRSCVVIYLLLAPAFVVLVHAQPLMLVEKKKEPTEQYSCRCLKLKKIFSV